MPFTHYPKLDANVIFAWVWPKPADKPNFLGRPRFGRYNLITEPLEAGKSVTGFHSAQNFTRFYGSIACDQPLEVTFSFSNDEVAEDGHWVTDASLPALHYDAEALKQAYDPQKQAATGKYLVTIYGRWLRVDVKNVGKQPASTMRVFVRGSVF
jgi:hypothetical protein